MNSLIGIRTSHPRNQAAADLCLWPHCHWYQQETGVNGKGFFELTVDFKFVPHHVYYETLAPLLNDL